jgi:hypothetical protein
MYFYPNWDFGFENKQSGNPGLQQRNFRNFEQTQNFFTGSSHGGIEIGVGRPGFHFT